MKVELDTADRLNQVEEYYFSKKLREIEVLKKQGIKVINAGIGSPDLSPHPVSYTHLTLPTILLV